jgi:hypothetical protein
MNNLSHLFSYCLLLLPLTVTGCAQNPATNDHLKPAGWLPSNFQLLKQPIYLSHCIDKNQTIHPRKFTVKGLGVILHPNPASVRTQAWSVLWQEKPQITEPAFQDNDIGVSIIPYLIDSANQPLLIAPKYPKPNDNFDRFLPACQPGLEGLAEELFQMPYYYPTMILTAAPGQRDNLLSLIKKQLDKECLLGGATQKYLATSENFQPRLLSDLLKAVFEDNQARFLPNVPYVTEVTLAETAISFPIISPATGQTTTDSSLLVERDHQTSEPPHLFDSVQVTFTWPQQLGKLTISNCAEAKVTDKNYQSICSFSEGTIQKIATLSLRENPQPQPSKKTTNNNARKLIIVSLSVELDSEGIGKLIQTGLYNVFKELKNAKIPFTLLAIGSGRQLSNPLLRGEELPSLVIEGDADQLRAKLRQLQFSATDLNALDDLELIDVYTTNGQIPVDRILYLTDNMHLSDNPPRKQLGVPLAWNKEGIQLTVLTTQKCTLWEEQALANCILWQDKQQNTLENVLKEFLKK